MTEMEGSFPKVPQEPAGIPENLIAQGMRATFDHLQKQFKSQNISKRITSLRVANSTASGLLENESLASAVAEINSIAGFFGEKVWASIHKEYVSKPDGDAEYFRERNAGLRLRNIPQRLSAQTSDIINHHIDRICDEYEFASKPHSDFDVRAFDRYTELLQSSPTHDERFDSRPKNHLRAGFGTANNFVWGILDAVPQVYESKYGHKIPSIDELDKLIIAGRKFAVYLSTLKLELFGIVAGHLQPFQALSHTPVMGVELLEQNGAYMFSITSKYLTDIAKEFDARENRMGLPNTPRTGCPALSGRGPDGKNIIVEFYDWYTNIARKLYFPEELE